MGRELKNFGARFWEFHEAYYQIREFIEPLRLLGKVVDHIWPWSFVWDIERQMEGLIDNAMLVFNAGLSLVF